MRAFLLLIVVLVVLAAVGWLVIRVDQGETTMTIKTGEMKEAAEQAVDETEEAFHEAGQELRQLVNEDDDVDVQVEDNESIDAQPGVQTIEREEITVDR